MSGPVQFVTTCPHCGVRNNALNVVYSISGGSHSGYIFLECKECTKPSAAEIQATANASNSFTSALQQGRTLNSLRYELVTIWPEPPKPKVPESLPNSVSRAMFQAESNYSQQHHEEASAVMYRKALESGLKEINPSLKGTLAARIEKLGQLGRLTSDIVDWAKEIKNLGNDGAHEIESISRAELTQLRGLTEMVLQYLFTIPAIVDARRKEAVVEAKET